MDDYDDDPSWDKMNRRSALAYLSKVTPPYQGYYPDLEEMAAKGFTDEDIATHLSIPVEDVDAIFTENRKTRHDLILIAREYAKRTGDYDMFDRTSDENGKYTLDNRDGEIYRLARNNRRRKI